jgi:ribose transport system substrate-binding protein
MSRVHVKRGSIGVGLIAMAAVVASGCAVNGSDSDGDSGATKTKQVAFLNASSANTWLTAAGGAMKEDAKNENVKITEFDGKFDPAVQSKQLQDVISSNKYDGLIVTAIDGSGIIPGIKEAIKSGLKVVVLNQVVGSRRDTADPQVKGIAASVLAPPQATGSRLGELTVKACQGIESCRVVYLYGQKGLPYDTAVRDGFDGVVDQESSIKILAEGQGGFLGTDQPRKAVQDILQAHPDFDVLAGSGDQQVSGALLALKDANKRDVKVIGVGGSGTVAGAPIDEGHEAFKALIAAFDGKDVGGIDATSKLPDDGLVTPDNVRRFTAQWKG